MSESQSSRRFRRAKMWDTVARWGITLGGVLVVFAIVGIFVEIAAVTLPLFGGADAERAASIAADTRTRVVAAGVDDYGKTAWRVNAAGRAEFFAVDAGRDVTTIALFAAPVTVVAVDRLDPERLALALSDGRVAVASIRVEPRFDAAGTRTLKPLAALETVTAQRADRDERFAAAAYTGERLVAAWRRPDGGLTVQSTVIETSLLGGESETTATVVLPAPAGSEYTLAALDHVGRQLAVARDDGNLDRFSLADPANPEPRETTRIGGRITALAYLLGDVSLAVGREDGSLSTWFEVRKDDGSRSLHEVHLLTRQPAAVDYAIAAPHAKALATVDALGVAHLDHATSERRLLSLGADERLVAVAFNGRGNNLAGFDDAGNVHVWRLDTPHPEVSAGTLFGKVWYEGYDEPAYVWQSSSGSADFEPKLSLVPLIFGTFKATFYAMLFSVPIALLAAIYASQFLGRRYHRIVKPVVELMAAFPSVVIGFLAALWLAPKLETNVVGFFTCALVLPFVWLLWIPLWRRVEARYQALRGRPAIEYIAMLPLLYLAIQSGLALGGVLEQSVFAGSFQQWLYDSFGTRYDQRNSIVIAFALGFAVVPLIFTMADDALANVPKNLTAASLALGASRWQTVWKIVLPSASPGIFAAVMIGFGRAVGETMIVLMAAGNTPILDPSAFNGMRTLSANIAVEIPEAPHGGTLYRVLFLSALLLFSMTFVANTFAEIVRTRLRNRYGRF